jgi:hypothetical protein
MIVSGSRSPISRAAYDRDRGRVRAATPPPIDQRNSAIWNAWSGDMLLDCLPEDIRPNDSAEGFAAQQE